MYLSHCKVNLSFRRFGISMLLIVPTFALAESTDLVFATPPTQSVETTKKNYQPLVDYLSQTIHKKIILKPARNFQEYTKNMREGRYDLIFDGPHFINWRIQKQHHVVVAKQPGELHFAIIVKKNSSISQLRDLWAVPVCSPAVPHLGTLTLLEIYSNPIREPTIIPVQSFKHALQCLRDDRAVAALVRDKYWFKKADKRGLKVLFITKKKMPARGLSVGQRVNKSLQRKITTALTSKEGRAFSEKAFSTIGGGKFVRANTREFSDLGEIIKIVWGFHE